MNKWLLFTTFYLGSIFANGTLDSYHGYLEKIQLPNGEQEKGEIEVLTDPIRISEVSKIQEARLLRKGFSQLEAKEYSRIGVIQEDQYLVWIRDAVYFPNKVPGTYDRIIWKSELSSPSCGVAVLPILSNGNILLNINYRHATRSWEIELPRGAMLPNETVQDAAIRELKEETGATTTELVFLGTMNPDSGILSASIPVFLGKISSQGCADPEESEAIAGQLSLTKEEVCEGLVNGFIKVHLNGEEKEVPIRDSFLTYALFQAIYRKII